MRQQNDALFPPPVIKEHLQRPPRRPEVRVRVSPVLPCSRALGLDRLGTADKMKGANKLISWRPSADGTGIKAAMSHPNLCFPRHGSLLQAPALLSKTSCTTRTVGHLGPFQQDCKSAALCSPLQPSLNILFRKRCCNISKGNPMCRSEISQSEPLPDLSELTFGVGNLSQTRCNKSDKSAFPHRKADLSEALTSIRSKQHRQGFTASWKPLFNSATIGSTDPRRVSKY